MLNKVHMGGTADEFAKHGSMPSLQFKEAEQEIDVLNLNFFIFLIYHELRHDST